MIEIACTCDDLPSHSHVFMHSFASDVSNRTALTITEVDPFDVRIWVDWKDVARELMTDGNVQAR